MLIFCSRGAGAAGAGEAGDPPGVRTGEDRVPEAAQRAQQGGAAVRKSSGKKINVLIRFDSSGWPQAYYTLCAQFWKVSK